MSPGCNRTEPSGVDTDVNATEESGEDIDRWFIRLYHAHRDPVFATALRLCGHRADAEDLAAEVFLRAYRAARSYGRERRAELRVRAWLMAILWNLRRNTARTAARRPAPAPLDGVDVAAAGEGVEEIAERHEAGGELARLLRLLPERQRAAVVLRHVGDLPVGEIAVILGVPEGTVKSHLSRGLGRLRELSQGGNR